MFKEKYKEEYDRIHPSKELMENTKKLVLEQYLQTMEKQKMNQEEEVGNEENINGEEKQEETEEVKIFIGSENEKSFYSKRKIIYMVGGLAASLAIISTGAYLKNSLKKEIPKPMTQIATTPEVVVTTGPAFTPVVKDEQKNEKKKKKAEKKPVKKSVTSIAGMSRSGGVRLDYASSNLVVFHGNFGIVVYSLSQQKILTTLSYNTSNWTSQQVCVNTEGTKIWWYNMGTDSNMVQMYDISTGKQTKQDCTGEVAFSQVQSVSGSEGDFYCSEAANQDMIVLWDGRIVQLLYQAPNSTTQASLGISLVDLSANTETIYSVFGSEGKALLEKQNIEFGNYYNEKGKELFQKDEEMEQELENQQGEEMETATIATEENQEMENTEIPVETEEVATAEPSPTTEPIQTAEPTPTVEPTQVAEITPEIQ